MSCMVSCSVTRLLCMGAGCLLRLWSMCCRESGVPLYRIKPHGYGYFTAYAYALQYGKGYTYSRSTVARGSIKATGWSNVLAIPKTQKKCPAAAATGICATPQL